MACLGPNLRWHIIYTVDHPDAFVVSRLSIYTSNTWPAINKAEYGLWESRLTCASHLHAIGVLASGSLEIDMTRVVGVGQLEWSICSTNNDLNFNLYLDAPCAKEGEVNESVMWNWNSSTMSAKTSETKIVMDIYDTRLHESLKLPKVIVYALHGLLLDTQGTSIRCSWHGGKRVDICISGYSRKIRHPIAFLSWVARRMTEWVLFFPTASF